jgi:hypothetical protein
LVQVTPQAAVSRACFQVPSITNDCVVWPIADAKSLIPTLPNCDRARTQRDGARSRIVMNAEEISSNGDGVRLRSDLMKVLFNLGCNR